MKTFAVALSAFPLLLSACAPPSNVAAPAAAPRAAGGTVKPNGRIDADPALWIVKDADTTIYLFGTVHVLRANVDWFDGKVKQAYDASAELVLEAVAPASEAAVGAMVMRIAVDPDGPPLTQKLDPGLRAKYTAAMAAAKLTTAQFEALEPWFVASLLSLEALKALDYNAETGVEAVLTQSAKRTGKPIGSLETFEQQLGFLDTLPEPLQVRFLASTIDELPEAEKLFADLVGSWTRGDAERLGALMNEGMRETPEIAKILLTDRNARWAQWIDDRLDKPGITFMAVGAGHLAGADSVQAMLAKRGLRVTRVQ